MCTEVGGSEHTWCFCEELRIGVLLWDMVFDRSAKKYYDGKF
jgi:hypothetical protein